MYKFDLNDSNEYYYNRQLQPHEIELSHEDFIGCTAEEIISKLKKEGYKIADYGKTMIFGRPNDNMNGYQMWFDEYDVCKDYENIY